MLTNENDIPIKIYFTFLIFVFVLSLIGYYYYEDRKEVIKHEKHTELTTITELKIHQISRWREERINNGKAILYNTLIIEEISKFISNPADPVQKNKILSWFSSLKELYDYNDILLVTNEGKILLNLNKLENNEETLLKDLLSNKGKDRVIFDHLHKNSDGKIHIDLIIPYSVNNTGIGFIVVQIDPYKFLYPLIQSWPTPSKTSESLIIRRDKNDILFLNELRHRKNTALNLRIPITQEDLPAAKAALGIEGIVEGKDYRQVEVLASVNIHKPNWFWDFVFI
ncbi:MAG: hypothetical protein PVH88_22275 [Ignavibacteria bacterium]|jgi:hypothetical protein